MRSYARLLLAAQLCLLVGLLICVLLIPHYLFESNEGGVSNYGTYTKTVAPYTIGLGACSVLTLWAARFAPMRTMRRLLAVLGMLYLFVLLSTYSYKLDTFYDEIHHVAGAALVIYTLGFGTWLSVFKVRNTATIILFAAQVIGFLLAVLTFTEILHVLFIAELLESLTFGALLVTATVPITEAHRQPEC